MKLGVFDIVGPIMIGPSSSHTAGAVRLGRLARSILGKEPCKADIFLHGSFAQTCKGHGTDVALVAGLLGLRTDDERIPLSLKMAEASGWKVKFTRADLGFVHPNTAKLALEDDRGTMRTVLGSSVGGGNIVVSQINDFAVELTGEFFTLCLLYPDRIGMVARVSALLAEGEVNIARMRVSREARGARALMVVETDKSVPPMIISLVRKLKHIDRVLAIDPIK
ncbi:MAG TPA: L-serine ammonia-lyase, iron-sulfur-dependent, subunit beta [Clostridia bacterium]|nr:L-serine ammonia-lyase, iron-sulfur-dependent, subunit beta [Clostridia bacterium]